MLGNKRAKGFQHSKEAKKRISEAHSNDKHWAWKGEKASYSAFHKWLVKNYGKPTVCENKNCPQTGTRIEYALLAGQVHAHNRTHYINLCVTCHRAYDSREPKIQIEL